MRAAERTSEHMTAVMLAISGEARASSWRAVM